MAETPDMGKGGGYVPLIQSLKIEDVVETINNIGRAIETMSIWLVQAQTGYNAKDHEGVMKMMRGEFKP